MNHGPWWNFYHPTECMRFRGLRIDMNALGRFKAWIIRVVTYRVVKWAENQIVLVAKLRSPFQIQIAIPLSKSNCDCEKYDSIICMSENFDLRTWTFPSNLKAWSLFFYQAKSSKIRGGHGFLDGFVQIIWTAFAHLCPRFISSSLVRQLRLLK